MLDAGPGQLRDVNHTVHAADVYESAVRGQALHSAGIALVLLDVGPHLGGLGGALLGLNGADGAHHTAAGAVDLGDAQADMLLEQLAHRGLPGQASLGGGHKDAHTLDGHNDAALVLLGDHTLNGGVLLTGLLDVIPALHGVKALLGEGDHTLLVVHTHDIGLNLVADLYQVLNLGRRVVGQFGHRYVTGVLGAEIHIDLSRRNASDNAHNLLPCI